MKICSTCKQLKGYSQFHKLKTSVDGYTRRCKSCQKETNAKHYKQNKDAYLSSASKNRLKTAELFQEFKNTLSCTRCNESRSWCLAFHHTDPSKKDLNVSAMMGHGWNKIREEVEKCVVLCHNCHADEHHKSKHPRTASATKITQLDNGDIV